MSFPSSGKQSFYRNPIKVSFESLLSLFAFVSKKKVNMELWGSVSSFPIAPCLLLIALVKHHPHKRAILI